MACEGFLVRHDWIDRRAVHQLRKALDRRFDPAAAPIWVLASFEMWHQEWASRMH
jgi:hypothetical protein